MGVVHAPDFPVEVGPDVQLGRTETSVESVDALGNVMLVSLSDLGERLTPGQMDLIRHGTREEKREIMEVFLDMERARRNG